RLARDLPPDTAWLGMRQDIPTSARGLHLVGGSETSDRNSDQAYPAYPGSCALRDALRRNKSNQAPPPVLSARGLTGSGDSGPGPSDRLRASRGSPCRTSSTSRAAPRSLRA